MKRNRCLIALTLCVGLILVGAWLLARQPHTAQADPGTLFVATDGNDGNDCSTIANRCRTVQRAVQMALQGDTIKVAAGTYTGTNNVPVVGDFVVALTKTVVVRGGYDASFVDPPDRDANPTVLHGEGVRRVLYISGSGPTLENLIITGGYGSFSGGGIYVEHASPIIAGNQIFDNVANGDGGAIFINGGSAQVLENQIISNTATWSGGLRVINDADVIIAANQILTNVAQNSGGGIDVDCCGGTTPLIEGNVIAYNDGGSRGGGIIVNSTNGMVINNILAHNECTEGAGIHLEGMLTYPVSVTLLHNTVVGDPVADEGIRVEEYVTATLVNNIMANHLIAITSTVPASSTVTANYTLFDGNVIDYGSGVSSSNEVSGDPAFVAPVEGNYHIGSTSVAIDAGVDAGVTGDIDGDLRPIGLAPDIGADEAHLRVYLPLVLKQY